MDQSTSYLIQEYITRAIGMWERKTRSKYSQIIVQTTIIYGEAAMTE